MGKFRLEKILPARWTNRYFDQKAKISNQSFEVGWLQGSAILIRRKTVEDIGFFDENFFLFSEDVDFCQRAKRKNWKVIFMPQAQIIHLGGYSGRGNLEGLAKRIEFAYSRRAYFAKKNWGKFSVYLIKFISFFDLLLRIWTLTLKDFSGDKKGENQAKLEGYRKAFFSVLNFNKK